MLAYLRGVPVAPDILLTSSGTGFRVVCPTPLTVGRDTDLWIHHQHTDSGDTLYGFETTDARDLFAALLRCPGVGGRTAADIIAAGEVPQVVARLRAADVDWLTGVRGIGRAKAAKLVATVNVPDHLSADDTAIAAAPAAPADDLAEAVAALAGTDPAAAADTLAVLRASGCTDEATLLRRAVATLSGARR